MNDQESKRTIDEVIDVETGEIIKSDDFFKKTESEIIAYRRRLQEAISGFQPPKFKCAYCNQLLKLSGKKTLRGQVSFFSHLYDSEDCEIKTNGELSKEEIEARKYSNIQESERHVNLKGKLAFYLKSTPSVFNVECEKTITSEIPYLHWRRPDIYAEYSEKKIVLELQLSTTFLNVIIERDIFYRHHNIFIIWVFNFSENQEFVNFKNLMIKDIYYANKRNAFVFDDRAQTLSQESGELHLLCIWFEPCFENRELKHKGELRKEKYIKLSDLKFDDNTFKPYYIDADTMFAETQSDYFENKIDVEKLHKLRLDRYIKKKKERESIEQYKIQKIENIKKQLSQGIITLLPFKKGAKWGFEALGEQIITARYAEVTDFSKADFARVKYNRKYGFVNRLGEFVFEPVFLETFDICNNKCIVKDSKSWHVVDLEKRAFSKLDCEDIIKVTDSLVEMVSERFYRRKILMSMEGNKICKCLIYDVYQLKHNSLVHNIGRKYFCVDSYEKLVCIEEGINFRRNLLFTAIKLYIGVRDQNSNIIIPSEYDLIENFIEGRTKAKKHGKYGVINEKGEVLVPFEFDSIEKFVDGKAKAKKHGKYGVINEKGEVLVPFEFDSIEEFVDGKAKARKQREVALIDYSGNGVLIFKKNTSFEGKYGETITKILYGVKDLQGNIILNAKYDKIDEFENGIAKVYGDKRYIGHEGGEPKFKYKVGCIDETGKIVVACSFDEISEIVDGKAKVRKNGETLVIDIYRKETKFKDIDISYFKRDTIYKGIVSNIVNYGLFIKLEGSLTGLLHVSKLVKYKKEPSDYFVGEEIDVQILNIDQKGNRISLRLPL